MLTNRERLKITRKIRKIINDLEVSRKALWYVSKEVVIKAKSDLIDVLIMLNKEAKDTEKKPYKRKRKVKK